MQSYPPNDATAPVTRLARHLFASSTGDAEISFEFFPPKTPEMQVALAATLARLEPLGARFASVTYGAGGRAQAATFDAVRHIATATNIPAAAHLTCIGATRAEVDSIARDYWDQGVSHIVALRGDSPQASGSYEPHPGGYRNAADLVAGLRKIAPFEISVAAYPEGHPDSPSLAADIDNLKAKFDAGATRAITQFFFSPDSFFRFRDRAAAAGIDAEIVPGILPVSNVAQTRKFAAMCGTAIPPWMDRLFDGLDADPDARQLIAATIAAELCGLLYAGGVRHFHFYTLNRADLTYTTCRMLGLRPKEERESDHRQTA